MLLWKDLSEAPIAGHTIWMVPTDPYAIVLPGDPTEPSGGGNFGAAAALRAKLQGRAAPVASAAPKRETVVLPQVDAKGRAMPGAFGREAAGAGHSLLII